MVERRLREFANKVRRRIFGPKRDDLTRQWIRLRNEKLYALFSSPNIIRAIIPRRLGWTGHVARITSGRVHRGIWWENLRNLEDPGVDGRIILK